MAERPLWRLWAWARVKAAGRLGRAPPYLPITKSPSYQLEGLPWPRDRTGLVQLDEVCQVEGETRANSQELPALGEALGDGVVR